MVKKINLLLLNSKVQAKELESLIVKLNHAAFILPFARYFLSSLRDTDRDMQKKTDIKLILEKMRGGGNFYYPLMLSSEKSYVILSHLTCVQKGKK